MSSFGVRDTSDSKFVKVVSLDSGYRRDADEICIVLGYYAASCGNCLLTFRVNNYYTTLRNIPEKLRSCESQFCHIPIFTYK
jgi:hypothetical protein